MHTGGKQTSQSEFSQVTKQVSDMENNSRNNNLTTLGVRGRPRINIQSCYNI